MPYKLLLADDSVTIQRVIELTFADEDIEVATCGDGQEAIERIAAERPDIVLADAGMPERDGFEVARYVKSTPELAHIPVLLLTGAFDPVDEGRVRSAGCDGVLAKPFEPQLVITRVKDILRATGATPRPASAPSVRPAAFDRLRPMSTPAMEPPRESSPRASAASSTPAPVREPSFEKRGTGSVDSLDDYFDRLDAAFAAETASEHARIPLGGPDTSTGSDPFGDLTPILPSRATPPPAAKVPEPTGPLAPPPAPSAFQPPPAQAAPPTPVLPPALPVVPVLDEPRFAAPPASKLPPPEPRPGTRIDPSPAAASSARLGPPPAHGPVAPRPSLAQAFASVLAAEQGRPGPLLAFAPAPEPGVSVLDDAMIERIVARVVEKMSDRVVREAAADIVSKVAERLVREEIDRIKAAAR